MKGFAKTLARFLRLAPATDFMADGDPWTAADAAELRAFLAGRAGRKLQRMTLAGLYRRSLDGRRYDDF